MVIRGILDIEDVLKYLGVIITTDLTWEKHNNTLIGKENKALDFIRRKVYRIEGHCS